MTGSFFATRIFGPECADLLAAQLPATTADAGAERDTRIAAIDARVGRIDTAENTQIDPLFAETHARAWDMGMMIQISSNGSRLDRPKTLDLLTARRPYRLTLSLYGATEESYDGMTRRRGSFRRFMRGLAAAHEAGLPMRINIVVSNRNAHEIPQMKAIADRYGIPSFEYTNISPTIRGGGEVLPSQSREMLRKRKPYTGCNAGITHFHADPHGRASICKVGRDPQVDLIAEGATGLRMLAAVADALVTRHGRMLRLHAPEDVRDLYAAGKPLPAGQGPARSVLPARKEVTQEHPASTGRGSWLCPSSTNER